MSIIRKSLGIIFILLFMCVGIGAFFIATEPGLHASFYLADHLIDGNLSATSLQGTLIKDIKIKGLHYRSQQTRIDIKQLHINWRPWRYFYDGIVVHALDGKGIHIHDRSPAEASDTPTPDWLRAIFAVEIRKLDLQKLSLDMTPDKASQHIQRITLESRRRANDLLIKRAQIRAAQFQLQLHGRINRAAPYPLKLTVSGNFRTNAVENTALQLKVSGSLQKLHYQGKLSAPFTAELKGDIDRSSTKQRLNLEASWRQLQWPLLGTARYKSHNGKLNIRGDLASVAYNLTTALDGQGLPHLKLALGGHANETEVLVDKLQLDTLGGVIQGQAKMTLSEHKPWQAQLNLQHINPRFFLSHADGDVNAAIKVSGIVKENGVDLRAASIKNLSGQVNGSPLKGDIALRHENRQFHFASSKLQLGENTFAISGGYNKQWDLRFNVLATQLGLFDRNLKGQVQAQGHITGERGDAQLALTLQATALHYLQHAVDSAKLVLSGKMSQHTVKTTLQSSTLALDSHITGRYNAGVWQGKFDALKLVHHQGDTWTLKQSAPVTITPEQISVPKTCLSANLQKICLHSAKWQANSWQFSTALKNIKLAPLLSLITDDISLDSIINGQAQFSSNNNRVTGMSKLSLTPGIFAFKYQDQWHKLRIKTAKVSSELGKQGLYSAITVDSAKTRFVRAEVNFPDYDGHHLLDGEERMQATIAIGLNDLSWVSLIEPMISQPRGTANIDLNIDGTMRKPQLRGKFSLTGATAEITRYGLKLKNIDLLAKANGSNRASLSGSLTSGKGKATISGSVTLKDLDLLTDIKLRGHNLQIVNTHEYDVEVDPNITIKRGATDLTLTGAIKVGRARITPEDFSNTVELPNEVSFINESEPEHKNRSVNTRLTITAGDDVQLRYRGLQGMIGGEIRLNDEAARNTTASGQLLIHKGKYKAYGQELTITNGSLFYTGNRLDNPGINLTATREITVNNAGANVPVVVPNRLSSNALTQNKITVGITITGTIDDPQIKLFSRPAIPQSDILSYLVLGKPVRSLSEGNAETDILFSALSAVNLGGHSSEQINKQLIHRLGIDKLELTTRHDVDPETGVPTTNTALTVGKAITSKLYIDYTRGLLQSLNIIRISYRLTNNLLLQSENSDRSNSGDILYTIERN